MILVGFLLVAVTLGVADIVVVAVVNDYRHMLVTRQCPDVLGSSTFWLGTCPKKWQF